MGSGFPKKSSSAEELRLSSECPPQQRPARRETEGGGGGGDFGGDQRTAGIVQSTQASRAFRRAGQLCCTMQAGTLLRFGFASAEKIGAKGVASKMRTSEIRSIAIL
jgi:hypothetical protein